MMLLLQMRTKHEGVGKGVPVGKKYFHVGKFRSRGSRRYYAPNKRRCSSANDRENYKTNVYFIATKIGICLVYLMMLLCAT